MPRHVGQGELLEPAEPRDDLLRRRNLQGGWPLSHRMPPASANLQLVLQLRNMRAERDSCPVCGQRGHHLAVRMWPNRRCCRGANRSHHPSDSTSLICPIKINIPEIPLHVSPS
jgi:hypothetical protein